jgi:hypothetical protein
VLVLIGFLGLSGVGVSAAEDTPVAGISLHPDNADGHAYRLRGVEEKDGFAFLLTRVGELYVYSVRDVSERTSFARYDQWLANTKLENGAGLLRIGDCLYAYGGQGMEILDIRFPLAPNVAGPLRGPLVRGVAQPEDLLITYGYAWITLYDVKSPACPTLLSLVRLGGSFDAYAAVVHEDRLSASIASGTPTGAALRTFDVSDPASPTELPPLSTELRDRAYDLYVVDEYLIEVGDSAITCWATSETTDYIDLEETSGRVAALDGDYVVLNGQVVHVADGALTISTTFEVDDYCIDGVPYGSVVRDEYVYLARSGSVLILRRE